jgi:hypothetical protein
LFCCVYGIFEEAEVSFQPQMFDPPSFYLIRTYLIKTHYYGHVTGSTQSWVGGAVGSLPCSVSRKGQSTYLYYKLAASGWPASVRTMPFSNSILRILIATPLVPPAHTPHLVLVKLSRYRPGQVLGLSGDWGSRISRQSAHKGCKVVSPTHRPSLPQEGLLVLISVRGWAYPRVTMRPEELSHWKIPVAPSGIKPATFRFVEQCLNQLRLRVPPHLVVEWI